MSEELNLESEIEKCDRMFFNTFAVLAMLGFGMVYGPMAYFEIKYHLAGDEVAKEVRKESKYFEEEFLKIRGSVNRYEPLRLYLKRK